MSRGWLLLLLVISGHTTQSASTIETHTSVLVHIDQTLSHVNNSVAIDNRVAIDNATVLNNSSTISEADSQVAKKTMLAAIKLEENQLGPIIFASAFVLLVIAAICMKNSYSKAARKFKLSSNSNEPKKEFANAIQRVLGMNQGTLIFSALILLAAVVMQAVEKPKGMSLNHAPDMSKMLWALSFMLSCFTLSSLTIKLYPMVATLLMIVLFAVRMYVPKPKDGDAFENYLVVAGLAAGFLIIDLIDYKIVLNQHQKGLRKNYKMNREEPIRKQLIDSFNLVTSIAPIISEILALIAVFASYPASEHRDTIIAVFEYLMIFFHYFKMGLLSYFESYMLSLQIKQLRDRESAYKVTK